MRASLVPTPMLRRGADIGLGLLALQREGGALGHSRVQSGKIIFQGHGNAPGQVVEGGDAVQPHGKVLVDLLAFHSRFSTASTVTSQLV